MKNQYLKPLHCGISVSDIKKSISWYEEMLDFKLLSCKEMPLLNATVAFVKHGEFEIEIFEHYHSIQLPDERRLPNLDIKTQGTKHLCFEVDDISGLFANLKARGVEIVMGPMPMEGTTMGFIRDNNGILIEFMEL